MSVKFDIPKDDKNCEELSYENLSQNPLQRQKFEQNMRETIAATYKCNPEDVVIVAIRKGSTIVDFVIKKFVEVVNAVLKTNFDTDP